MKFWISPYELKPRGLSQFSDSQLSAIAKPGARGGVLLRFDFGASLFGYADCHPWPELGDLPWAEQVALLQRGRLTELTSRSLAFARLDAEARKNRVSLWSSKTTQSVEVGAGECSRFLAIPPSHTLVPDLLALKATQFESWALEGQTRIKFKVGKAPQREAEVLAEFSELFIKNGIQVRLDFNGVLTPSEFEKFLKRIDLQILDFIEDPFPYDRLLWSDLQREYKIRLALDRVSGPPPVHPGAYSVLVLKPAIQDPAQMVQLARAQGASLVVTSYMDHPYGQLCAAWEAARLQAEDSVRVRCGLLTHLLYEPPALVRGVGMSSELGSEGLGFAKRWTAIFGAQLHTPRDGFGFGLDFFLENQAWEAPNVD